MATATDRTPSTRSIKSPTVNGLNGLNGFHTPPISPAKLTVSKGRANGLSPGPKRISSANYSSSGTWSSAGQKLSIVDETSFALKRKSMSELGAGVAQDVEDTSFLALVDMIRKERLTTLPHKGSAWDTVLIRALYFAEHLHSFEKALQGFAGGSNTAAQLGYGHTRILLELGHENSEALMKAFGLFYKCSLMVSTLFDRSELLSVTSDTREQLCMMYADLLTLVVDVAVRFYKVVHGIMVGSVSLDMYEVFGDTIETFRSRRDKISDTIWQYQIETKYRGEGEFLTMAVLNRWLAPQDRVLRLLAADHTTFADQQAEYTCLWFQDELITFVKSNDDCLLLNAQPGSGKTTLAASIVERLQRPVARTTHSTLFCSIGSVPSQADTLHVVKTLLYQLLNIRLGNMKLYEALVNAHEQALQTTDPKAYEEHLWTALKECFQDPLDRDNDIIIVLDGLDEVQGGQSAGQALLERLVRIVGRAKRTKLIALSNDLSLPSGVRGTRREITPEATRDDIKTVTTQALAHCPSFHSKSGSEQESIVAQINTAARGSFLWTVLVCENLRVEKTSEGFTKTLQSFTSSTPPTVVDIVTRLLPLLHPNNDAMLLLNWLISAARPLTYDELESMLIVDVEKSSRSNRLVDVHGLVQTVRPLLSVQNDVVRTRHNAVRNALRALRDKGKIPVPLKDGHMDLLLRTLTYAKITLHDKGEPTLDNTDQALLARLFPRHYLLEYVVRYWPYHLKKTGVFPLGSKEPKISPELQRAFPDSTTMSVLEWLCWDEQFPGAQEVKFHVLVGRLRKTIFTENHPAVLQSYVNTATYYEAMGDDREAGKFYYLATVIGQTVLSAFHPVTIECATRFLSLTNSMTTTSRTEVMTQRERVFIILITAYERQFGFSSDLVIRTKQLLADLYIHIHEETRAAEILVVIHGDAGGKQNAGSGRVRDISGHLRVQLGKGKSNGGLESYGSLFTYDEEFEESDIVFDLARVIVLLQEAAMYVSQKKFLEAEQTYVELWQKLSVRCRSTLSSEWHESKIDVVNEYSRFLSTQNRKTETSAILTCLAREYEHHELSYSEKIVSRLVVSAEILKSVGQYNAALSIWRQASTYYKSTKREQSHSFTQIEEEIAFTSTEVLKHATSSSTTSEKSSSISESSLEEIFTSMITNSKMSLDMSTMTLAKQLSVQYQEQRQWAQAITVIHSTLERTWASFFAASIHDVTMTSVFLQESVELVEQLVECYMQQRLLEKVMDIRVRLFRATLTSSKHHRALLEKSTMLVISFYDKHGYPDKAIGIFQELLAVYRRVYGPSHDLTIQTLYELGARCRSHARTHPYWIEYYQQITVSLNTESEVHLRAMDATIIVVHSYWEERRYTEAVQVFKVLWSTFISQTKQYKQFSDTTFVQELYDRYSQSLEATQADWATLHRVTKQYRETCKTFFGASAAITVNATLTLAHITQSSEEHTEEAISWFEEVSKSSTSSMTQQSSELRQTLATLYKRRITSGSSASSETITRAASVYQEQLSESKNQYGYAHSSTLSNLREFSILQCRQQKTDVAIEELHIAVAETITKETSEETMLEVATSIAHTFKACQLVQSCTELIQELHFQLVAKEKRKSSRFAFDLTSCGSASLVFLANLEYTMRSESSYTFSEILSNIIAEHVYFERFRYVLKARSGLAKVVIAAAPLRHHLKQRDRKGLALLLEEQVVDLFVKLDTANLSLMSAKSPHIFIIGILKHLGNRRTVDFVGTVVLASNISLTRLIDEGRFAEAYDVANMAFIYAQAHKGYDGPKAVSRGFKLAAYLDGRGENRCPDEGLRNKLLELSNRIIKEILEICRHQDINMAQVQLSELNEIIALLGEQRDHKTLESLLTVLWNTRDAQRSWPRQVLVILGRRLICARYQVGRKIEALRLCEDIAYNLRRVHGTRHPATLDAYGLLAQLYTSTGQLYQANAEKEKNAASIASDCFKKAILVHEDVLRWLMGGQRETTDVDNDEDDDEDTAATILKEHGIFVDEDNDGRADEDDVDKGKLAKLHFRLLKLAFQRFGSWPKQYVVYERLNADVYKVFGPQLGGMEGVEKWQAKGFGAGKAESSEGAFEDPTDWEILPSHLQHLA